MTKSLKDRLKGMDAKRVQEWKADLEGAENRTPIDTESVENRNSVENRTQSSTKDDLESLFDVENRSLK